MKTLENILNLLGSEKPFLKEMKIYEDGSKEPFTKKGGEVYGKLIEILYTVGEITETEDKIADIVECLDNIASEI